MSFLKYALGPRLFATYGELEKIYEPNTLESIGDRVLSVLGFMYKCGYYTSPLLLTFLYHRGYLVADNVNTFVKIGSSVGILAIISICLRAVGRKQSPQYVQFYRIFEMPKTVQERKTLLEKFDYDFTSRDVDFDVAKINKVAVKDFSSTDQSSIFTNLKLLPCNIAAYFAIHTFGIRMIYPGSIKLLQSLMRPILLSGRKKLIEENDGKRYKIRTIDGNHIDSLFIDRRIFSTNGSTLVICTEGNAGFYEIGVILGSPLGQNYSVLGWNHPGFEGSTGTPYPSQEKNAVNAVVLFAVHHLGFKIENIILYGWSIGGYSTLFAATSHPNVKGIILDATFDDILHLARNHMPAIISPIVEVAIRKYCNLNNTDLISSYNGPVSIIRRTEDEIISLDGTLETNRGNNLLVSLLKYRYPYIFGAKQQKEAIDTLKKSLDSIKYSENNFETNLAKLRSYVTTDSPNFPINIGQDYSDQERSDMAMFLIFAHLKDYKSVHCAPLPSDYFRIPWNLCLNC